MRQLPKPNLTIVLGIIIIGIIASLAYSQCAHALPATSSPKQFTWNAPTQRCDAAGTNCESVSPSDIGGYFLYWKSLGQEFTNDSRLEISGGNNTRAPVSDIPTLTDGIYDFAVTAFGLDVTKLESGFSESYSVQVVAGALQFLKKLLNSPTGLTLE